MIKLTVGDYIGVGITAAVFTLIVLVAASQLGIKNPFNTASKYLMTPCSCNQGVVKLS